MRGARGSASCAGRERPEVLSGVAGCGLKSRTQCPAGPGLPLPLTCWVTLSMSPHSCASTSLPGTVSTVHAPCVPVAVLLPHDTLFCLDRLPVFLAKQ